MKIPKINPKSFLLFFLVSWVAVMCMWPSFSYHEIPEEPIEIVIPERIEEIQMDSMMVETKEYTPGMNEMRVESYSQEEVQVLENPPAMAGYDMEEEEAPEYSATAKVKGVMDILKIIFTGLIGFANLLGGSILLWQKVLGVRK